MTVFNTNNRPEKATDVRFATKRQKTYYEKSVEQAVAEAVAAGIPTNGVAGQILTRTLDLWEWADSVGGAGVDYTGATTGQVFSFNGTTGYWRDETTEFPTPGSVGDVPTWNGTDWVSDSIPSQLPATGTAGNFLQDDGTNWISATPDAGIVTATGQAAGEVPQFDGSNGYTTFKVTISTSAPSGGIDGDLWFRY